MKIQINGFDIEILEDTTSLAIKVLDASGKELSNNTYSQSSEGAEENTDVVEPELTDAESIEDETSSEEDVQETEETTEEDVQETTDEETIDEDEEETLEESVLTFEQFKKLKLKK